MEVKKYRSIQDSKNVVEKSLAASEDSEVKWYGNTNREAMEVARRLRRTSGGMYSTVPIICRAEACPYAEACELVQMGLATVGEKCPMEIAAVEDLFQRYCADLMIDPNDPTQQIDAIMVKDLIDLDIGILRCDKKIAINADYIIENVVGVTEEREAITQQVVHPIAELKEKLRNNRNKMLSLFNSTRKDKMGSTINVKTDPLQKASQLMATITEVTDVEEENKEKEEYLSKLQLSVGEENLEQYQPTIEAEEVEEGEGDEY